MKIACEQKLTCASLERTNFALRREHSCERSLRVVKDVPLLQGPSNNFFHFEICHRFSQNTLRNVIKSGGPRIRLGPTGLGIFVPFDAIRCILGHSGYFEVIQMHEHKIKRKKNIYNCFSYFSCN